MVARGNAVAMKQVDYLVIGAGIAGLSAAARLARHGETLVCEAEDAPGVHSSGRSAAFAHFDMDAWLVRALTAASIALFEAPGAQPHPALFVALAGQEDALDRLEANYREWAPHVRRLSVAAAQEHVPVLREGDPAGWTPWTRERYEVRTHVQDMAENILDRAHFVHVHDMEEAAAPRFEIRFDGAAMTVEQNLKMSHGPKSEVASRTTNHGPGLSITRVDVGQVHSVTFITHTPIDADRVAFQLAFSMHRLDDPEASAAIERINREIVNAQAMQDMPIWENKIYRAKPILTPLDGPVHAFRRWYRRFYSELPAAGGEDA